MGGHRVAHRHAEAARRLGKLDLHPGRAGRLGGCRDRIAEQIVEQAGQVHRRQGALPGQTAPDLQLHPRLVAAVGRIGQGHVGHRVVGIAPHRPDTAPGHLPHPLQGGVGAALLQQGVHLFQAAAVLLPQTAQGFQIMLLGFQFAAVHLLPGGGGRHHPPGDATVNDPEDRQQHRHLHNEPPEGLPVDVGGLVGRPDQRPLFQIHGNVGPGGEDGHGGIGPVGQGLRQADQSPGQDHRRCRGNYRPDVHDEIAQHSGVAAVFLGNIDEPDIEGRQHAALQTDAQNDHKQLAPPVVRKAGQKDEGQQNIDGDGDVAAGIRPLPRQLPGGVGEGLGGEGHPAEDPEQQLEAPVLFGMQHEPVLVESQQRTGHQEQAQPEDTLRHGAFTSSADCRAA